MVDVAFSQSHRQTYGVVFFRDGGANAAEGLTKMSTVWLHELGFNNTNRWRMCIEGWCRVHAQFSAQGATLCTFQGQTYEYEVERNDRKVKKRESGSTGIVFHSSELPEEVEEVIKGPAGCCVIL